MTREEHHYRVTSRHQLIDLNKDCTNFKLRFECYCDPAITFEMCVTNQDELDSKNLSDLPMKNVEGGFISGNILADSNTYQNYFMVLRSEKECEVTVKVDLEPIEFVPPPVTNDGSENLNHHVHASSTTEEYPFWKRILFYFGIGILLCIISMYILRLGHVEELSDVVVVEKSSTPSLIDDLANHL